MHVQVHVACICSTEFSQCPTVHKLPRKQPWGSNPWSKRQCPKWRCFLALIMSILLAAISCQAAVVDLDQVHQDRGEVFLWVDVDVDVDVDLGKVGMQKGQQG